jgi:hypothetical protein
MVVPAQRFQPATTNPSLTPGRPPQPARPATLSPTEVTRRVSASGLIGVCYQQVSAGRHLAGHIVTVRLHPTVLQVFVAGQLIRTVPRRSTKEVVQLRAHQPHKPHKPKQRPGTAVRPPSPSSHPTVRAKVIGSLPAQLCVQFRLTGPAGRRPTCHPAHPRALVGALNGILSPAAAAEQAQADLETRNSRSAEQSNLRAEPTIPYPHPDTMRHAGSAHRAGGRQRRGRPAQRPPDPVSMRELVALIADEPLDSGRR